MPPSISWYKGLYFSCKRCGNCCTFPGGSVFGSQEEFQRIADYLKTEFADFLQQYTIEKNGMISLRSVENGPCVFYENGCRIYEVRPLQCGTFPFWPENLQSRHEWDKTAVRCAGIGKGQFRTADEIRERVRQNGKEKLKSDCLSRLAGEE